jgi:hypothetical protein
MISFRSIFTPSFADFAGIGSIARPGALNGIRLKLPDGWSIIPVFAPD